MLGSEIYSFQAVAFKEYIRMVATTLASGAYYWLHAYALQRAPRAILK